MRFLRRDSSRSIHRRNILVLVLIDKGDNRVRRGNLPSCGVSSYLIFLSLLLRDGYQLTFTVVLNHTQSENIHAHSRPVSSTKISQLLWSSLSQNSHLAVLFFTWFLPISSPLLRYTPKAPRILPSKDRGYTSYRYNVVPYGLF